MQGYLDSTNISQVYNFKLTVLNVYSLVAIIALKERPRHVVDDNKNCPSMQVVPNLWESNANSMHWFFSI